MRTRCKRLMLLVVAVTAITSSASFALSDPAGPSACMSTYSNRLNAPNRLDTPRHPILIDPELKHDVMFQANAG
jgi:hypothetical protein